MPFPGFARHLFSKVAEMALASSSTGGISRRRIANENNVLASPLPAAVTMISPSSLSLLPQRLVQQLGSRISRGGGLGTGRASGVPFADHSQYIPRLTFNVKDSGES